MKKIGLNPTLEQKNETRASFAGALLAWYEINKRELPWRNTKDPYHIWVSEIMLQQTQVKTVIPYYERFIDCFPTIERLAKASEDEVLTLWQGLGYYSRARHLREGAIFITAQFQGSVPQSYHSLLNVPGIGEYTAGAIASIAFGQKVNAIDGNVNRVVSRVLAWGGSINSTKTKKEFSQILDEWQPGEKPGDFNQGLMELGATICSPKAPKCDQCPVQRFCKANHQGEELAYPIKKKKSEPRSVIRLTFVLRSGDTIFLQQRPYEGMLARLWELPGVEIEEAHWMETMDWLALYQQAVQIRSYDEQIRTQISRGVKLSGPLWYTFSHRKWQIFWVFLDIKESDKLGQYSSHLKENPAAYHGYSKQTRWLKLEELSALSIPNAFKELINILKNGE